MFALHSSSTGPPWNPWTGVSYSIIIYLFYQQGAYSTLYVNSAGSISSAFAEQDIAQSQLIPRLPRTKCGKHRVYDFPARPQSQFAIHGAGVCIAISSKTFSPRNVVSIADVPEEFAGRVAAIRVRRQDVDRAKIAKVWEYLCKLLNNIPSRCVPVICIGANGRVGSQTSDSVGRCDSQCEIAVVNNYANCVSIIICAWLIPSTRLGTHGVVSTHHRLH